MATRRSPSARSRRNNSGALSGQAIRRLLEATNDYERLVIAPLLDPEEQLRDEQASIDVRLGCSFAVTQASSVGEIDELSRPDLRSLFREHYVPLGNHFIVHPHQLVLATTLEYLRLPDTVMCYVVGRSTWGRLGLIVATAVGVHPLFSGTLTLEIRNLGEAPIRLYPGHTIAQLFFHWVEPSKTAVGPTSQYTASIDPIPGRLSSKATLDQLRQFREDREIILGRGKASPRAAK